MKTLVITYPLEEDEGYVLPYPMVQVVQYDGSKETFLEEVGELAKTYVEACNSGERLKSAMIAANKWLSSLRHRYAKLAKGKKLMLTLSDDQRDALEQTKRQVDDTRRAYESWRGPRIIVPLAGMMIPMNQFSRQEYDTDRNDGTYAYFVVNPADEDAPLVETLDEWTMRKLKETQEV